MGKTVTSEYDDGFDDIVAAKQTVSQDEIREVFQAVGKRDKFPIEGTKMRNIIMLGMTGSGKSQAIDVLKDARANQREQSLFSDPAGTRFSTFALEDMEKKLKYTLSIIDTPGVKETRKAGEKARDDNEILETVKFCLRNNVVKIHCLFIFVSLTTKITNEHREAFRLYQEMFYNEKLSIVVCVTHAEGESQVWKDGIVRDLQDDVYFKELLALPNVTVRFLGCVSTKAINSTETKQSLFSQYMEVYNFRTEILKTIFSADDEGVMLQNLPIITSSKTTLFGLFDELYEICDKLATVEDYQTNTVRNDVMGFNELIQTLVDNQTLLTEPELYEKFILLKKRMIQVAARMPQDIKTEFTYKVII